MKKPLGSAFFWLLVFLLAAELIARAVLPYSLTPNAASVYRNPLFQHSWPEFTRDSGDQENKLVIIIGNSQAFGWEIHDSEKIYFARLKKEVLKQYTSVAIENWTPGALRTPNMELLTLKALERKPDLLVFVVGFRNFSDPERLNLEASQNDIPLLAGSPATWPYLKQTTFYPSLTVHDIIERYLMLQSAFVRSRTDVMKVLAFIPLSHHNMVFGHKVRPVERFDMFRNESNGQYEPPKRDPELEEYFSGGEKLNELSRETVLARLQTFKMFYPSHERRFSDNNIRSVWVWMPMAKDLFAEETITNLDFFNREASNIIEASGVRTVDLTREVPTKYFLTRSHLDEKGHEIMGDLLFKVIQDELQ